MLQFPFTSVEDLEGKPVPAAPTATGWQLHAPSGLTACVKALRDARICRTTPGADCDVLQFGCGWATSLLCDALYSPSLDLVLQFSAPGLSLYRDGRANFAVKTTGSLEVTAEERFLETRYRRRWHISLERKRFGRPPAGWSSGPAYGAAVTEADILENADWLARNLLRFGCDWVQVDDGWQGGEGEGPLRRDWGQPDRARFPSGMKGLAAAIRSRGLRPALWCIPLVQSSSAVAQAAPQLWLEDRPMSRPVSSTLGTESLAPAAPGRRADPAVEWAGRYVADPTAPEAGAYFRRLAREICEEWRFEGLKFGGLASLLALYRHEQASLWLSSTEPAEAIRRVFHYMRIAAGPAVSFRADSPHTLTTGYCDTVTTGNGSGPASSAALDTLFLNGTSFYTEPGPLCISDAPLETSRLWVSFLALTGQAITCGDKLPALSPEQVELLRRVLPVAGIHPMDFYPRGDAPRPRIVVLKVQHGWVGSWDVVALCNWDAAPAAFELSPERLGLPEARYVCLDAWSGELLGAGPLPQLTVPPQAVRVFSCWPELDRPQFVGSSRHLTQGAIDVDSVTWEERRLTLRGESTTVRDDPYVVRIYVPPTYRITAPNLAMNGPIATLTISHPYDGRTNWWVRFVRETPAP